ncbi:DUF2076 domain-containing protein [Microvirga sp. GCM10011540]|uniref:DUF2076 domain-containing protein n=1 Tax=Microvirga sp. GCM10011540 TaxID=3317338 RepID=UPI003611F152
MNDQEREVISDIFRRLEQVANQPRDPEAERLIADKLRQQPYAPYAMAQTIFVQEQALGNLQAENEQLRAELDQARRQPQQGGFLSGLFGGGSRPQEPTYRHPPGQASPWGAPQPQHMQQPYGGPQGGMMSSGRPGPWGGGMMQQRSGGGFLQGALSTAAGVAGGMMIANALSHAFGGNDAAGTSMAAADAGAADLASGQGADAGNAGITESLYENPQGGHDDYADFGGDGGDGGDWA